MQCGGHDSALGHSLGSKWSVPCFICTDFLSRGLLGLVMNCNGADRHIDLYTDRSFALRFKRANAAYRPSAEIQGASFLDCWTLASNLLIDGAEKSPRQQQSKFIISESTDRIASSLFEV